MKDIEGTKNWNIMVYCLCPRGYLDSQWYQEFITVLMVHIPVCSSWGIHCGHRPCRCEQGMMKPGKELAWQLCLSHDYTKQCTFHLMHSKISVNIIILKVLTNEVKISDLSLLV